jgi:uncharacterized repeat protein (TIGR01451 family)
MPSRETRPSRHRRPILRAAVLFALPAAIAISAAAGAAPAAAQPRLKCAYAGFTDLNGNGGLDCGEPVDLIVTFATRNSGTPALTGTLVAPASGSSGIALLPGSVRIDPDLTVGCTGTIVSGNGAGDGLARVDFSCPPDPLDNNSWTAAVRYRAVYTSAGPAAFTAAAQAATSDGASYRDAVTEPAASVCAGPPPAQVSVTKTAAGPATPGSLLVYTIGAADRSGLGAGGVQLVEAVPEHTSWSAAGSSPGWQCSPGGGAGALCRNQVGNLDPNGSLSRFFAVVVDAPLPAAPVVLANTACARLGPDTVAGCASLNTVAAGTPVLRLVESLAAGPPQTGTPGATLTYTLAGANLGNQDLADAVLREVVPALTAWNRAASAPGWSCAPAGGAAGAACTLDLGALPAGGSASRNFAVTVANPLPPLPPGYVIVNGACLHTAAAGVADSCASLGVAAAGTPMLQAAKTLKSGSGKPGGTLVYDLAVQNTGNQGSLGVDATETVPAHTAFAAAASSPAWACNPASGAAGAVCTLPLGPLDAGAAAHVPFAVTVELPLAAGVAAIDNTACFQFGIHEAASRRGRLGPRAAPRADPPPSCDTLRTPTAGHPLLTLDKSYGGGPAAAGALLVFRLLAGNGGDQDAAGVTLTETVPAHSSFAAGASSPGWSCAPAAGGPGAACTLGLGALAGGGGSATASFAVRADSPLPPTVQQIGNVACVAAPGLAPVCAQATTPPAVSVGAELRDGFLRDLLGNGQAVAGDDLSYTLTVSNSSAGAALGLVVAIPLDPRLSLDVGSVATTAGEVVAGNGAGDGVPAVKVASLAAGASFTVAFSASVGPIPAGLQLLASQATLSGSNFPATVSDDPDTPEPLDPTTTPVAPPSGTPPVQAVPTLGGWGLIALAGVLGAGSLWRLRGARLAGAAGAGGATDGAGGWAGAGGGGAVADGAGDGGAGAGAAGGGDADLDATARRAGRR